MSELARKLLEFQRYDVVMLERSVRIQREILADYEARLAQARKRLAEAEDHLIQKIE
ncbi:hypothetical protein PASE110613_09305 [Paenibacillus sediminis]|uniref:Uncharacterized protein n=1 Tax=Paenibacillus sediminis TaxID=664909 RepID=A0ABS4H6P1_9BACL|nr:hypothetical protein [Paenibacillus sediminis]MBP1938156.1 hypothetical protein [Paenibacillus sediminis]